MLLNWAEKALMNNPIRAGIHWWFEAPRLVSMGGAVKGAHALEVGCGRGVGVEIIIERFGADRVDAFDLDPDMVELARRRLDNYRERVRLWTGDVTAIEAEDAAYDAVFDFGIIHHVPDWRKALSEIKRVLKPGGRLYAEEVYTAFISNPIMRRLFYHTPEDRFDHRGFYKALEEAGFRVLATREMFGWFVADKA